MADTYEQNLAQKSVITASDFIRVVGSDNVSYKQPINAVLNGIPSTTRSGMAYLTDTDFDTITYGRAVARGSNSPTGLTAPFFYVDTEAYTLNNDGTVNAGFQVAWSYSSDIEMFVRRKSTNESWGAWQKMPTRAEVDALNSKAQRIESNNTSITLSLSANSVYMLVLLNDAGLSQYRNVSIISTGASGGTILPLAESALITTTISGLSLTVTRSVYVSGVLYKFI